MTLGVRGVARDAQGRVCLVRHTYLPDWWLPGGGVEQGQTAHDAVVREMREEAGVVASGPPRLLSVHSNARWFPGDHVMVFAIDAFDLTERTSFGEIEAVGWFALDALPPDMNAASARRLAEIFGATPTDPDW